MYHIQNMIYTTELLTYLNTPKHCGLVPTLLFYPWKQKLNDL